MGAVTYATLEHVAEQARPYPAHLLDGCETGLVLFAAAFLGHNDAIHFAEAGLETTCVDIDEPAPRRDARALSRVVGVPCTPMRGHCAQAAKREEFTWDAVSVDTFTGSLMDMALDSLELWTSLANRLVTVTITTPVMDAVNVPHGWETSLYPRSRDVSWLVLTRAIGAPTSPCLRLLHSR